MYNGIINVYKERGFTSHDVVAKLRGILKQKKIGHTGTLDPDAEGVLPVCVGSGTKLCDMLTDRGKEYEAVLLLGVCTDTEDISGQVIQEREVSVTEGEVRDIIMSFIGGYEQVPPMYSALRINGRRLYELAREGRTVERQARHVDIDSIEILSIELPRVKFRVGCGKGTYIRSLCRDIGAKAGCGGCMESLVRTRAGGFELGRAHTLEQISGLAACGGLDGIIIPVDDCFPEYPRLAVSGRNAALVRNGNMFYAEGSGKITEERSPAEAAAEPQNIGDRAVPRRFRVYTDCGDGRRVFAGIYEYDGSRGYRPVKMFPGGE